MSIPSPPMPILSAKIAAICREQETNLTECGLNAVGANVTSDAPLARLFWNVICRFSEYILSLL